MSAESPQETVAELDTRTDNGSTVGHAEIGDRIAAILDAAEASAEQIRQLARDEATGILRQAHETAARRIADLTREPERLRDEAALDAAATRASADDYAAKQRRQAELQARDLVAAAEGEAAIVRADAEQEARRVEGECRRREEAAGDKVRALTRVRDDTAASVLSVVAELKETAQRFESNVLPFVDVSAAPPAAAAAPAPEPVERPEGLWSRLTRREPAVAQAALPPGDDAFERTRVLGRAELGGAGRHELEAGGGGEDD